MRRLFSLVMLVTLAACGRGSNDDARVPAEAAPMLAAIVPLSECPDDDYSSCDIRDAACQQSIAQLAACVRGSEAVKNLQVDVLTEAEYADVVRQDLAEVAEPAVPHFDQALSIFGLALAAGVDREEGIQTHVENLGGVYRPLEKRIIIVDHDRPADSAYIDGTLLHEFIHSQQDADYDLLNWPNSDPDAEYTFDQVLARNSLIEGEATFYQYRAEVPRLGLDIAHVDFKSAMSEHLRQEEGQALGSPTVYNASYVTFPYGFGGELSYFAWLRDGPPGIQALWAAPPNTSQAVMSEVFGLDTPQPGGLEIPAPDAPSLVPYTDDVLGAWGTLMFMMLQKAEWTEAMPAALKWRGDHLWVYTDDNDQKTYALWLVELASPEAATMLNGLLEQVALATEPLTIQHASTDKRAFASIGFEIESSPELTDAGKAWLSGD